MHSVLNTESRYDIGRLQYATTKDEVVALFNSIHEIPAPVSVDVSNEDQERLHVTNGIIDSLNGIIEQLSSHNETDELRETVRKAIDIASSYVN